MYTYVCIFDDSNRYCRYNAGSGVLLGRSGGCFKLGSQSPDLGSSIASPALASSIGVAARLQLARYETSAHSSFWAPNLGGYACVL